MELIIDTNFTKLLAKSIEVESINFSDFKRFLSRSSDLTVITNHNNYEEFEQQIKEDPILELLINNGPITLKPDPNFPTEIDNNSYYQSGSPFKLFLLTFDNAECEDLCKRFGYEYISPTNFEEKWTVYYGERQDSKRKVTNNAKLNPHQRFDSWSSLQEFTHPVNSILINDSYILIDQPNQTIKDNLSKLLKELCQRAPKSVPLEIIICSDPPAKFQVNFKQKHAMIKIELDQLLGKDNYTLNLIKYSSHSRFILTNYFLIRCENSFNFFKRDGKLISDDPRIEFLFVFSPKERSLTLDDLRELKEKIIRLENSDENAAYEVINYYPERGNRLLN